MLRSNRASRNAAFPIHRYAVSGLDLEAASVSGGGLLPSIAERLDPAGVARLQERCVALPSPGAHRRKARLPDHAVELAKAAVGASPSIGPDCAVHWGTAIGAQTETAAFLENLFEREGGAPKPRAFTASVHNAIASRLAQVLDAQGDNETFVHGEVSAVIAAWAVQRGYRRDTTRVPSTWIHGALDEHSKYVDRAIAYCDRERSERNPNVRLGRTEGGALFVTERDANSPALAELAVRFGRPANPDGWIAQHAETLGVDEFWLSGTWHARRLAVEQSNLVRGAAARWSTGAEPEHWGAPTYDSRSIAGRHPSAGASAVAVALEARRAERVGVVTISRFGDVGLVVVAPPSSRKRSEADA